MLKLTEQLSRKAILSLVAPLYKTSVGIFQFFTANSLETI